MVGMRDVAKRAGVSVSSVSLVINGTGYVSRDMREKVEQAMRELDYVPNELARNFYHGKTDIIGVIVPTIQHPFFATLTAHLQHEFADRGLQTMLCSTADSANGEAQYVDMLRRHSLDALVVAAHTTHDPQYLARDRPPGGRLRPQSGGGDHSGEFRPRARRRAHRRTPRAHRRAPCGHGGRPARAIHRPRRPLHLPHRPLCTDVGRPPFPSADCAHVHRVGRGVRHRRRAACVREAFDTYPDMDAFVGADLAAAFAVQEAVSRSIAVPGDVQIIAYDGTLAADCAGMPLTTVAQDFRQIAHTMPRAWNTGIESSPQRPGCHGRRCQHDDHPR